MFFNAVAVLQVRDKAFSGPCRGAAVQTTAGPFSPLRYDRFIKSMKRCAAA